MSDESWLLNDLVLAVLLVAGIAVSVLA